MGESSGRESIGGVGADAQGAAVRRRRRTLARSAVETLAELLLLNYFQRARAGPGGWGPRAYLVWRAKAVTRAVVP